MAPTLERRAALPARRYLMEGLQIGNCVN